MEERLEWLMAVSSSQVELDSKMDDEWKGGTTGGGDNTKAEREQVGAGKKDLVCYCS